MSAAEEPRGAWLIGRVQTGHALGAVTDDPIVTMTLWAVGLRKPGEFAMAPANARVLAQALLNSADAADGRPTEGGG